MESMSRGNEAPDRESSELFPALLPIRKTENSKELSRDKEWNESIKEESEGKISTLPKETTDDEAIVGHSDDQTADDFRENLLDLVEAFKDENSDDDEAKDAEVDSCSLFELRRRTLRLYQCEDHNCKNCVEDLDYLFTQHFQNKQKTTDVLLGLGVLELFQQIWVKYFRGYVVGLHAELEKSSISKTEKSKELTNDEEWHGSMKEKSESTRSVLSEESTADNAIALENKRSILSSTCGLVTNMTDFSGRVCDKVIEMELYVDLISYLRNDSLQLLLAMKNEQATELVESMLHVLHNVVQVVPEARELYREEGIVDVLKKFRACENEDVSCLSLMFLAWVVNEEENSAIDSGEEVFQYLFKELESSLSESPHRSYSGYKATEILEAITKLAAHDANKERVIQSGGLSIFAKFLQPNVFEDEQYLAAEIIWTLAFKCAEEIKEEENCVKYLESLLEIEDVCDSVKRLARGALITLGVISQNHARSSVIGHIPINEEKSSKRKIFISYNHGSKEIVFKIRDHLRQHGLDVWIDADEISGSLDEDIIDGINGSSVVVTCLSQKYYESPTCRKEVTYADDAKKNIIPVTVEFKFKPQGWLQFRMGDKLRIDFSQSETFEESLKTLLQRLRKCLESTGGGELVCKTMQGEHDIVEVKVGKQYGQMSDVSEVKRSDDNHMATSLVNTTTTMTSGVVSWTAEDVQKWLEESQLEKLRKFFDGYDGRMLLCYKSLLLNRTSECFQADFISKFSVKEFVRLHLAVQNL